METAKHFFCGNGQTTTKTDVADADPYPLLSTIHSPADLRRLDIKQLPQICLELREYLIDTLSNIGGHFASNLGVVELTVALHYVYQTPEDKLIWDVGHQIYPHKILTGRREQLKNVRQADGLSGFPKRSESVYDLYNTGHAGTSISQLLGEAVARDMQAKKHKCVCVIGDASIASGMALEALNHGGSMGIDQVVILNDNDMSISQNVGALNQYLNRLISSPIYNYWRRLWYTLLLWLPFIGVALRTFSRRLARSLIDFFTPGGFFVNLGFRYFGPVDGHDVMSMVKVLRKIRTLKGPMLLHVYTQKGQGYAPAEKNPIRYHSVAAFNRGDGSLTSPPQTKQISYSQIVGETLLELAKKNPKVVAVTPAMIEGSGLRPLHDEMPERIFDVGIAEQHSVTFAGALASSGMVPYLCIYSTFLNRAIDQLIQDVALMNLPVRIIIDRAGCVGYDGETHQGLYDLGVLLSIPNIKVYAPANGRELKAMLHYMEHYDQSPLALRFPKASSSREALEVGTNIESYVPTVVGNGTHFAILTVGTMWDMGLAVKRELEASTQFTIRVVGLRWIRPMDLEALVEALTSVQHFIIIEDSYVHSSAAAYILQLLPPPLLARHRHSFLFPESVIEHGERKQVLANHGISTKGIINYLTENFS